MAKPDDTLTLREAAEAIASWLWDWCTNLGDIRVRTLFALVLVGMGLVLVAALLGRVVQLSDMAFRLGDLTWQYHAYGYPWGRALRLALADWAAAHQGQPSRWAATPEQRAAWAQDLEQGR